MKRIILPFCFLNILIVSCSQEQQPSIVRPIQEIQQPNTSTTDLDKKIDIFIRNIFESEFKKADSNKDGVISLKEYPNLDKKPFSQIDKNGDGVLSYEEASLSYETFTNTNKDMVKTQNRELFKLTDKNGDDNISRNEFLNSNTDKLVAQKEFLVVDKNKDNNLNFEEYQDYLLLYVEPTNKNTIK